MTQEDNKFLLIKDLYARAPYHPIVSVACWEYDWTECKNKLVWNNEELDSTLLYENQIEDDDAWEYIKSYLRPMSNMTEEEKEEYEKVCELDTEILTKHPMNGEPFPALYNSIDWLNKNHFDYRGLIEKGLAIEVTKENNPYEN